MILAEYELFDIDELMSKCKATGGEPKNPTNNPGTIAIYNPSSFARHYPPGEAGWVV
jgi:hypothetical protein